MTLDRSQPQSCFLCVTIEPARESTVPLLAEFKDSEGRLLCRFHAPFNATPLPKPRAQESS